MIDASIISTVCRPMVIVIKYDYKFWLVTHLYFIIPLHMQNNAQLPPKPHPKHFNLPLKTKLLAYILLSESLILYTLSCPRYSNEEKEADLAVFSLAASVDNKAAPSAQHAQSKMFLVFSIAMF